VKELAELAGYTSRVSDLLDTMDEVKAGKYQKKLVSSSNVGDNAKSKSGRASITDVLVLQGRGQIIESDEIRFDQVPLISPNGDVLVKSMSFNVEKGVSLRD
jgi:ATP-binding cassette subfamily D (ALD) long-chain fatty acid import protein